MTGFTHKNQAQLDLQLARLVEGSASWKFDCGNTMEESEDVLQRLCEQAERWSEDPHGEKKSCEAQIP